MRRRWSRPKRGRTTPTPRRRRQRPSSTKTPSIKCYNIIYKVNDGHLSASFNLFFFLCFSVSLEQIKIRVTLCTTGRRYFSYMYKYLRTDIVRHFVSYAHTYIILYISSASFVIMLRSSDYSTRVPLPATPFLPFFSARKPLNIHTARPSTYIIIRYYKL